jgi:hypothetical protein
MSMKYDKSELVDENFVVLCKREEKKSYLLGK